MNYLEILKELRLRVHAYKDVSSEAPISARAEDLRRWTDALALAHDFVELYSGALVEIEIALGLERESTLAIDRVTDAVKEQVRKIDEVYEKVVRLEELVDQKLGRCKDCAHWGTEVPVGAAATCSDGTRKCMQPLVVADGVEVSVSAIGWTGPDFGCVHFERRES